MKTSAFPTTILICLAMASLSSCKTVEPTTESDESKSSFVNTQSEDFKSSENQVVLSSHTALSSGNEVNYSSQIMMSLDSKISSQTQSSSSTKIENSSALQNSSEVKGSSSSTSNFKSVSASFTQTDTQVSGTYTIEKFGDKFRLKLNDTFSSSSGPDLHIVLTTRPESQIGIYNYKDYKNNPGEVLVLGGRETIFKGAEREIDLTEAQLKEFNTVLIQCIQYSHTYATATINW